VIAYSPDAEPARAYLLKAYNDIDIFVEDATCQNMYVRLIGRILSGKACVNQVFPLHGRDNVIAKCAADQAVRSRRRLYIIDADQDLVRGKAGPKLKHLYRLSVYCSENLLLSEHAAVTLATECMTNATWPDMAVTIALRPLLDRAIRILVPLFVVYATVRELNLGIETVSCPVQRLLDDINDPNSLSERRVRARILAIIRAIRSQASAARYRSVRNSILRRINRNKRHHSVYISGKSYLLPLAYMQLKRRAGLNEPLDRVKVRLAQHCELSIDRGLRGAILRALK
jgi:hypothetical protein